MNQVTVDKHELRKILEKNMDTHHADFELAWDGFQKKALQNAESIVKALKNVKKGGQVTLHVNLSPPQNHTDDYQRAIEMLDWEQENRVVLTQGEFMQLVQDDWGWKQNFTASNMMYTGEASPSSRR